MKTVERHAIDTERAARDLPSLVRSFERNLNKLEQAPNPAVQTFRLSSLLQVSGLCLGYRLALDPAADQGETWVSMTHAVQLSHAILATATTERDDIDCLVDQRLVRLSATGPTAEANAWQWEGALWNAVICRDRTRIRELTEIREEDLVAGSKGRYDDFLYAWARTLRAWFTGSMTDVETGLSETTRLLTSDHVTDRSHPDRLNEVVRPQILLLLHLASGDADGFNSALEVALTSHRSFWSKDSKGSNEPLGFIARGPLALTCIAHDRGLPIEVESPYLPKQLIGGAWVGEFPF